MFGIGWTEILVILVIALLVLGPTKLPDIARGLGKGLREFRKAMSSLDDEVAPTRAPVRVPEPPPPVPPSPPPAVPVAPAALPAPTPDPVPAPPPPAVPTTAAADAVATADEAPAETASTAGPRGA